MKLRVHEVRPARSPAPEESPDLELKLVRKRSMATVPAQHPECRTHPAGVRVVTDDPHCSPDSPELSFMPGVPPLRKPVLKP